MTVSIEAQILNSIDERLAANDEAKLQDKAKQQEQAAKIPLTKQARFSSALNEAMNQHQEQQQLLFSKSPALAGMMKTAIESDL